MTAEIRPANAEMPRSKRLPFFTPARLAISLMFLQNGFLAGGWSAKVPEFAARLDLSESAVGLMIFFFGLGSLIAMPLVGVWIARAGSQSATRLIAAVATPLLLLITLAPTVPLAGAALFLAGALIGGTDVAMNANAVEVEKHEGRSIMSSCHGFWSLGGFLGAISGGVLIDLAGTLFHAITASLIVALVVLYAWGKLLPDGPHHQSHEDGALPLSSRREILLSPVLWLLGIMALIGMNSEGAILDWGGLYLRRELGADLALSGFAFGAFSGTMAVMRFAGDGLRDRFGAVRMLRISLLFAFGGLLIAGLAPTSTVAIAGFAVVGIGLSNMIPILFSAAGNLPGLPKGVGISFVSVLGYSGILFAPSLIGFIAEHTGLARIFAGLAGLILVILLGSGLARHADRKSA